MIRINLLAVERERAKRLPSFQLGAEKITLACGAILIAAGVVIGGWFWSLRQEALRLEEDIRTAQQETLRLRSVLDQVKQFEGRRQQLQQRVALIEQLRAGQTGPVYMLDQISRSLPERLWLTDLKQTGVDVQIDGRTTSLTALSDFVGNLESSGYFRRPVEILNSQVEQAPGAAASASDLVRFSVKAQFAMPGS